MHTITVDIRMINASGIGTYIRGLLPEIISACPDVKFNLIGNITEIKNFPWTGGANVSLTDCSPPVYSISEQLKLPVKIPSCDIFWSPHYNIPLFPIRAKKRLVTIHDVFHLAFFGQLTARQKIYAGLMLNSAVRLSDKIITVSNFSRSEIMKHIKTGEEKITVIHNGINTEKFRETDQAALIYVKDKFKLPDNYILFVGNVKPHKNLHRLLSAYESLNKRGIKDYFLVIAGQKEGFITGDREIFMILKDNPLLKEKVIFTGYIKNEDLPAIYNLASLLVFPSLYEGYGLPPLEAMACGCPAVVSNVASLPEVCGDAAYYVDPYDIENVAEGMGKMLADEKLRLEMIDRGYERARHFSWKKSAGSHIKLFEEALKT